MIKKLILMVASLLLTILVVEIGFRVAGYRPIYDVYSKPEAFWKSDPVLGWTLEPDSEGTYVGPRPFPILFRTPIRINSEGLRGPEIAPVPPGGHRVLFLGDSQTAGFEVAEDRTFVARAGDLLQSRLGSPVQAINGGIRGYGTDQTLLSFRERLRKLQPEVVVYDKVANDTDDNVTLHRPKRPFGKAAYGLDSAGRLELKGTPVPAYPFCSSVRLNESYDVRRRDGLRSRALCWLETNLSDHLASFSFVVTRLRQHPELIRKLWNTGQPGDPAGMPAPGGRAENFEVATAPPGTEELPAGTPVDRQGFSQRLTTALIQELAREVQSAGAKFVMLVSDPDLEQLDIAAFERAGISILRPDSVLGGDQRSFRIPNDGHLNEAGHEKVAELVAPALEALLAR